MKISSEVTVALALTTPCMPSLLLTRGKGECAGEGGSVRSLSTPGHSSEDPLPEGERQLKQQRKTTSRNTLSTPGAGTAVWREQKDD